MAELNRQCWEHERRVSEEEIQRFEEDGATVVRQLFPPEWLDQLRAAAEVNMKTPGLVVFLLSEFE
jgi:hypothetical protein